MKMNYRWVSLFVILCIVAIGFVVNITRPVPSGWASFDDWTGYWGDEYGNESVIAYETPHGYLANIRGCALPDGYFLSWIDKVSETSTSGSLKCIFYGQNRWYGEGENREFILSENAIEASCYAFPFSVDDENNINVFVVWTEMTGGNSYLFINMFQNGRKIVPPSFNNINNMPLPSQSNSQPSIAFKNDGSPILCWVTIVNGSQKVAVSFWNNGNWTDCNGNTNPSYELIDVPQPYGGIALEPNIILDGNNLPVVAFVDMGQMQTDLFLVKRTSTGWENYNGGPILPIFPIDGPAYSPQIKLNSNGVEIVWVESQSVIFYARNTPTGWQGISSGSIAPAQITPPTESASNPHLTFDDQDRIVCYTKHLSATENEVSICKFSPGTTTGPQWFVADNAFNNISSDVIWIACWKNYITGESGCFTPGEPIAFPIRIDKGPGIINAIPTSAKTNCEPEEITLTPGGPPVDVKISFIGLKNGGSGDVTLEIGNLPANITATLSKTFGKLGPGVGFDTILSVTASLNALTMDTLVKVKAKNSLGKIISEATVNIVITNLDFFPTNIDDTVRIFPGSMRSLLMTVNYPNYENSSITLTPSTVDPPPAGLTLTWLPTSINTAEGNQEIALKIEASTQIVPDKYPIKLRLAASNGDSIVYKIFVVVTQFSIECYNPYKKADSSTNQVSWDVDVIPENSFAGEIKLSLDNTKPGISIVFSPSSTIQLNGQTQTVTITATFDTQLNNEEYSFDFRATASSTDFDSLLLSVEKGSFSIKSSQYYGTLTPGGEGSWGILLKNFKNLQSQATFQLLNVPSGWSYCFETTILSLEPFAEQIVNFTVKAGSTLTKEALTLRVTVGSETKDIQFSVEVQSFEIQIDSGNEVTIRAGESALIGVAVKSINGYSGFVDLFVSINPPLWWVRAETPGYVRCVGNGTVYTAIKVTVDGGVNDYDVTSVDVCISGKGVDDNLSGFCTINSHPGKISINSVRSKSITTSSCVTISLPINTINDPDAYHVPIVFECEPYKLVRQVKQEAGLQPVTDYTTSIPFLAINVMPPDGEQPVDIIFNYIDVLYPSAITSCKYSGEVKNYSEQIANRWYVDVRLNSIYNNYGYCAIGSQTDEKITSTEKAKWSIGMPTPSTISPRYISQIWPMVYSSEDIGQPCTNNVCIRDLRIFAFNMPYGIDLSELDQLDTPYTITIPLRANFTIMYPNHTETSTFTKVCEILYEKPLPTHSEGAEKIMDDWYVGDTHSHSACSKTNKEACPSLDQPNCPNDCGCPKQEASRCEIMIPGGPSMTQRAEQSREFNFDFNYCADHSPGDGGCADDAHSAYKGLITDRAPRPGKDCSGNTLKYNGGCEEPIASGSCLCTRIKKYIDTFNRDVVTIGKGLNINSQEVSTKPAGNCDPMHCTSHLVANYHGSYIDNFTYTKPDLIETNNTSNVVLGKYVSSIIAHPHESFCGQSQILLRDPDYPLTSEPSQRNYPGVVGFPWDYPSCYQDCDPWSLWHETGPNAFRHRVAWGNRGYDGMELVYYDWQAKEQTLNRWKKEISDELQLVIQGHPLQYAWITDEKPSDSSRCINHPFPVSTSNILRWWMGPFNRFWGKNTTYIHARNFTAYENDRSTSETGFLSPLGFYLRHGKTIASGGGSFATMCLGAVVEPNNHIGPDPIEDPCTHQLKKIKCKDIRDSFQPGDIIAEGDNYYKVTDTPVRIRILAKSAWSYGHPNKARLYIHNPSHPTGYLYNEYGVDQFGTWDFSDSGEECPGSPITDSDEVWFYKDVLIPASDLGGPPWAIRLEVDFISTTEVGGAGFETVYTAPIYSKNK